MARKPKRYSLRGDYVAAVAKPVWVCSLPSCEVHHPAIKDEETGK